MAPKPNKPDAGSKPPVAPRRTARSSRLRTLLLFLLLVLGVLFWCAPWIVARTPLRQRIVPALVPGYPAAITTGSASLDWFSPVELRDVVFEDLQGESLLSVPTIRSERTLIDIVLDSRNAGTIHLDSPKSRIVVRPGGSNLEDVVRPVLAARSEPSARGFTIASEEGDLELVDEAQGRRTRVGSLGLTFTKPSDPNGAWQMASGGSVDRPGIPGSFHLEGSLTPIARELVADAGPSSDGVPENEGVPASKGISASKGIPAAALKLHARADDLVLEEFQAAVARIWPAVRCTGVVDADLDVSGTLSDSGTPISMTSEGRVASRELSVMVTDASGVQRWSVRDLAAGGRAELADGALRLNDVRVKSDLARLDANGVFPVSGSASALSLENCHLQGEIDLTKLAQVFPNLVRVREGTELTAGTLRVNLIGQSDAGRRVWDGSVEAKGIAAIAAGRSITWDQPVLVNFRTHDSPNGPVLDLLDCKSDFLTATGRGSLADATVSVGCDLDRLATELGRFLELDDWRMAGKLRLDLSCRTSDPNTSGSVAANGQLTIENFALGLPGRRAWTEQKLEARFGTTLAMHESRIDRLREATLLLTSGADRLEMKLQQPVPWRDPTGQAEAPFQLELSGDLATWRARMQPFGLLADWDLQGNVRLSSQLNVSGDAFRWNEAGVTVENLRAWKGRMFVSDQHVDVRSSGSWNRRTRELMSPRTTWASNSLSLRADEIVVEPGSEIGRPGTVSGKVVFRGGVEQLSNWFRDPNIPPDRRMQGLVSGRLQLTRAEGISEGDVVLQFDDVVAYASAKPPSPPGWSEAWREKQIVLKGRGRYDHLVDTLEIAQASVSSEAFRFHARGEVGELTSRPSFDLSGEVEYDWANVIPRLRPWLGDDIQITGQQKRTFAVRGPRAIASARSSSSETLSISTDNGGSAENLEEQPAGLNGEAGLGWQSARFYGLDVGPVELQARLSNTTLDISPIDVALSEGRLTLAPQILLLRDPALLTFAPGRVAENIRLSPEMCRNWLKYVAPLMADATQAEGKFSLDLSAAELPVNNPKMGEVVGTLAIHEGDVSPGPAAQQLLQIAQQVKQVLNRRFPTAASSPTGSWVKVPEQNVEFQMSNGRVQHRLMEFQVGDVTIRTEGSVGFDETLALVATVPVRDEWVQSDKYLGGLKGQALRIPITGTLKQPIVDSRALGDVARRAGSSAAGQLLREGLGNQLDKLFGPKK